MNELTTAKESLQHIQKNEVSKKERENWEWMIYQKVARMKLHMYQITQQWHSDLLRILGITEDFETHDKDYVSKFAEFL